MKDREREDLPLLLGSETCAADSDLARCMLACSCVDVLSVNHTEAQYGHRAKKPTKIGLFGHCWAMQFFFCNVSDGEHKGSKGQQVEDRD